PPTITYQYSFFLNATSPPEIYTLSLHDALPILLLCGGTVVLPSQEGYDADLFVQEIAAHCISIMNCAPSAFYPLVEQAQPGDYKDRKSTRLNSSHVKISYAVFCLKKKKKYKTSK